MVRVAGGDQRGKSKIINMEEISEDALAGAISGLASRVLTAPLDVIKIRSLSLRPPLNNGDHRFQLQCSQYKKYHTILQTIRSIVHEEGVM
jgi:hypothetical protein